MVGTGADRDFFAGFLADGLGWPPAARAAACASADPRRFRPRAIIIRQGEACNHVYLIARGGARARHLSFDGRLVVLGDFGVGDLFGALGPSAAQPAEVAALGELVAGLFRSGDFLALIEAHACVGVLLSRSLLRQLQGLAGRMISRTTVSAAGRVHAELLARADASHRIAPPPVLSEIAAAVDTARETVSRAVTALERRGIVRRDADALVILAPGRLGGMVV